MFLACWYIFCERRGRRLPHTPSNLPPSHTPRKDLGGLYMQLRTMKWGIRNWTQTSSSSSPCACFCFYKKMRLAFLPPKKSRSVLRVYIIMTLLFYCFRSSTLAGNSYAPFHTHPHAQFCTSPRLPVFPAPVPCPPSPSGSL